jgi:hypothetical protein
MRGAWMLSNHKKKKPTNVVVVTILVQKENKLQMVNYSHKDISSWLDLDYSMFINKGIFVIM